MDKVIQTSANSWMSQQEYDARKKFNNDFLAGILRGNPTKREPKEDDNVKLAFVMKDGKQVMMGVDNKTMAGYEMNEETPTWKMPLVPASYESFVRWCRLMDV